VGRRFSPDALIIQEDRNLVMGAASLLEEERNPATVRAAAEGFEPVRLGSFVLVGPRSEPPTWMYRAVVHDLDLNSSCRPGHVRRCLVSILGDAGPRGIRSLGSAPLGLWRRSGLELEEVADSFNEAIFEMVGRLATPLRLTVLLEDMETLEESSRLFRSSLLRRASRSFHTVASDVAVVEAQSRGQRFQFRFVPGALSGYLVTRPGRGADRFSSQVEP